MYMKYYILYNDTTLEFKPIISDIEKEDKYKYYIEVSKACYNRSAKILNRKLRKDFKWLMNKINNLESYIFEDEEDRNYTTLEYHNLYRSYNFVYEKLKDMPSYFFYNKEYRKNFLKHCKDGSMYYLELYKKTLDE